KWDLENEERIYQECAPFMRPWAPEYFGGARADGWHVMVLEDVGPQTMPPWTAAKATACARSYAAFHAHTYGKPLPRWLSRIEHHDFAPFWDRLATSGELRGTASLARRRADEAEEWLDVALPVLREAAADERPAAAPLGPAPPAQGHARLGRAALRPARATLARRRRGLIEGERT